MADGGWIEDGEPRSSGGSGRVLSPAVLERIETARAYLHEHAAEPITLTTLSRVAALSPYYLVRVFKAHVGIPPHRYLMALRVERARRLLEVSSLSITQIAHRAGFGSASHFSTVFRTRVGLSPSEYRKRHLRNRWALAAAVPEAALA
ncbi:MAG: AraC family transcriptional regulator [Actinomycetota bacterium]|nr:AraC family transcriptional regulator [Actinomycetota bacterium]